MAEYPRMETLSRFFDAHKGELPRIFPVTEVCPKFDGWSANTPKGCKLGHPPIMGWWNPPQVVEPTLVTGPESVTRSL